MPTIPHHRIIGLLLASVACAATGCREQEPAAPQAAPIQQSRPEPSAWRTIADSPQVALRAGAGDEALEAAIAEARRTADDARERWAAAPPDQRGHWAVKWAAPTEDGGVEYVWVIPASWSPFRIEGRLASPPQRPLECGRVLDEPVGFPAEELVDWAHFQEGRFDGPREGGFTVALLGRRYGRAKADRGG